MEDGQHGAIANRVQELVDVPGGGKRARLRLAVADHGCNDQVGIIEGGAACVGEHVTELAAFVDGTGRFRRTVAADASGEGELLEERQQSFFVFALFGVDLRISALQVDRTQDAGRAVTGAGQEDHVLVVAA